MHDVAIVGAGPSGCIAACELAESGARVVLIDAHAHPRPRVCGGGVLARAVKHLPAAASGAMQKQCHALEVHLNGPGLAFTSRRDVPIVSVTSRAALDACLLSIAQRAGVELRLGQPVEDLLDAHDHVELRTQTGALEARWVIAADGGNGTTAARAGFAPIPSTMLGIACELSPGAAACARFAHAARFDFDVIDHGYGWVFPGQDRLSVGMVGARADARTLRTAFDAYLRRLALATSQLSDANILTVPIEPRPGPFARGRVLVTGEAAGFVDPLTGEGISLAAMTGRMAARAVLAGAFEPNSVRQHYQHDIEAQILPELSLSRSVAKLFYGYPKLRNLLFRFAGQALCDVMVDIANGDRYSDYLEQSAAYLSVPQLFRKLISTDPKSEARRT